jgi:hypothetical protein
MNDRMYAHPATQGNLRRLAEIGYRLAGPAVGPLAWGEGEGPGRMIEPDEIVAHAGRALEAPGPARRAARGGDGRRHARADRPRALHRQPLLGRMGYELAAAAWRRGADVLLVSGPSPLAVPDRRGAAPHRDRRGDARRRRGRPPRRRRAGDGGRRRGLPPRRARRAEAEKGSGGVPELRLEATADVLRATRYARRAGSVVVGFALETADAVENGRRKLLGKGLDLLVVNDATEPGAGFEVETNRVVLLSPDAADEALPLMPKSEVADHILDRVERLLARARGAGVSADAKELLRRYLTQRRDLGDTELVLDGHTTGDVRAALAQAERSPAPAARTAPPPPGPDPGEAPERPLHRRGGAPVPGSTPMPQSPDSPARGIGADAIRMLPTLDAVRDVSLGCPRCRLAETRRHVVFGEGAPDADILVVGEAPGEEEDRTGRPFVGKAESCWTSCWPRPESSASASTSATCSSAVHR